MDRRHAGGRGSTSVGVAHGLSHLGLGRGGTEVLEHRGLVEADLAVADQVVGDPVAQSQRIGSARPAGRIGAPSAARARTEQRRPSLRNFSWIYPSSPPNPRNPG